MSLVALSVVAFNASCTASGSEGQVHGPVYDVDGGDAPGARDAQGADDATVVDGALVDAPIAQGDAAEASTEDASAEDAALDASAGDAASDAGSCAAVTAVLSGGTNALFGATAVGAGPFTTATLNGAALSAPAIVAWSGGFQALFRSTNNALATASFTTTWSAPGAIQGALTIDAPALTAVGASLHAVYLGSDNKYYHAVYTGSWDNGADHVAKANDAGPQSIGPRAAAAATPAGFAGFVIANVSDGTTHTLYDQTWSVASGWGDGVNHPSTALSAIAPAMIAMNGGTSDLLVVYANDATKLTATLRDASAKTWSAPVILDVNAFTNDPPALAPMSNGRAVLVYRGADNLPYVTTFDPARATPWSPPVALVAGTNPILATPPSIASGVCGDDAVVVYVELGGAVKSTRFTGGSWTTPAIVGAGATYAAIATRP